LRSLALLVLLFVVVLVGFVVGLIVASYNMVVAVSSRMNITGGELVPRSTMNSLYRWAVGIYAVVVTGMIVVTIAFAIRRRR